MQQGTKMRAMSIVKVVLLAGAMTGAVAAMSLSSASAKGMKHASARCLRLPKGRGRQQRFCSFDCDPATNWCSQQLCTNGALTKVVPCYGTLLHREVRRLTSPPVITPVGPIKASPVRRGGLALRRRKRVTAPETERISRWTHRRQKSKLIKGATGDWEVIIGLEVHAQVSSRAKLFSGASTEFGGEANSHVSLVDAAMPGMLPVINAECVRQAVRTGLGLKAKINLKSVFDRKNYFYPDLPPGYQISQYKSPIVGEGEVVVDLPDGETVRIGIERLHLEQDAGKSLHDQNPTMSLVDLNRAGVALMEIVSKPDLRSADEAKAYVAKMRSVVRYLGTCDGDMEKGNLRADVNVSVRQPGEPLGTRCEIKNVNSIRFIGQAIEFEARRQIEIIEDGGKIEQETRLFDPDKGETRSMRSKEEAHDYRYFPDPDLLPLELSPSLVEDLQKNLPELPDGKKARFMRDYALPAYDADVLVAERETAEYFEAVVGGSGSAPRRDPKLAANWVINELGGRLNREGKDVAAAPVSAAASRRPFSI